jgi:dihydropteroate synthase
MKACWRLGNREIALTRPVLMGIVNVTPDSFADGGQFGDADAAVQGGLQLVKDGASILDVGGESTRPGAQAVPADEQIRRVVPVIRGIRAADAKVAITVDTTRGEVAMAAMDAGADGINDVSAGTDDPHMLTLAGRGGAGVVLMHRVRRPSEDQYSDQYVTAPLEGDVVEVVGHWLRERMNAALEAGVPADRMVIDPGLGFGKTVEQNLALIAGTRELLEIAPVLSALSRKSFVGRVSLERESVPAERLEGTIGLSVLHLMCGARLFRVHDVAQVGAGLRAAFAGLQVVDTAR